jgi:phosphopantothenoylcysteine decarboxylase/phosphopantothenate--cysteine ligase
MAEKKKILLILGAGIAAFKILELIRLLRTEGIEVFPVMTKGSKEFVTPLSVSVLSGNKVSENLFDVNDETEIGHIQLSRKVDLVVVAPLTANLLAKMALGISDDLASTILLATDKNILVAPSMNVKMWEHPATQRNLSQILLDGVNVLGPLEGEMACGEFGLGRMIEPIKIFEGIKSSFKSGPLTGKRVLVTSGPTYEPIDPVRFIGNRSSGKQGGAIADALISQGAEVLFISGPVNEPMPIGAQTQKVETAREMFEVVKNVKNCDAVICVAAVADWRVENEQLRKIKKNISDENLNLSLVKNPDILKYLSQQENRPKLVIGFAAETEDIDANGLKKLKDKGCDWIFANDVKPGSNTMGGDKNTIKFISNDGIMTFEKMHKKKVAKVITDMIVKELG